MDQVTAGKCFRQVRAQAMYSYPVRWNNICILRRILVLARGRPRVPAVLLGFWDDMATRVFIDDNHHS